MHSLQLFKCCKTRKNQESLKQNQHDIFFQARLLFKYVGNRFEHKGILRISISSNEGFYGSVNLGLPRDDEKAATKDLAENIECISLGVCANSATLRTAARQAPLSMGFSKQEYWSGFVAISYHRTFSWSRNQTRISCVSCIGRQTLYHWATGEACMSP